MSQSRRLLYIPVEEQEEEGEDLEGSSELAAARILTFGIMELSTTEFERKRLIKTLNSTFPR